MNIWLLATVAFTAAFVGALLPLAGDMYLHWRWARLLKRIERDLRK